MFQVFDDVHIDWLISLTILVVALAFCYVRINAKQRAIFRLSLAYLLVTSELVKYVVVWQQGKTLLYYIPIHLCGIALVLIMIHAYKPYKAIGEILFSLTLPGALIALIFPGWTSETVMGFLHIHSFVYHGLIVLYPLMLLITAEIVPQVRQLWKVALFLVVLVPSVYQFNIWAGTNYMFLNSPIKNSPLMWIYHLFGETYYIVGLVAVMVMLWVLQYGVVALVQYANHHLSSNKKKNPNY